MFYDALGTDIKYTIKHLITEDATISPTEHPLYRAISAVFTDFFPDTTVVPTIAAGGSDLRFARFIIVFSKKLIRKITKKKKIFYMQRLNKNLK